MVTRYVWTRLDRWEAAAFALLALAFLLTTSGAAGCERPDGEADIRVINGSSGTLITLQVKNNDDSHWGIDELRGIDLQPSQEFTIRDLQERENYDVQATDSAGFSYVVQRIRVDFGDETVRITDADVDSGPALLTIVNDTTSAWSHLYVRDRQALQWGSNVLTAPTLKPGASVTLSWEMFSRFGARAEGVDQRVFEFADISMNGKTKSMPVNDQMLVTSGRVTIRNAIDYGNGGDNSIMAVFLRPSGGDWWGPDLLPSSISNGATRDFELEPGTYDLRAVDVSGQTYQRMALAVVAGWPRLEELTTSDVVAQAP